MPVDFFFFSSVVVIVCIGGGLFDKFLLELLFVNFFLVEDDESFSNLDEFKLLRADLSQMLLLEVVFASKSNYCMSSI
jgi:hypothetical protein